MIVSFHIGISNTSITTSIRTHQQTTSDFSDSIIQTITHHFQPTHHNQQPQHHTPMAAIGVFLIGFAIYKTVEKVHDHREAKKSAHGEVLYNYDGADAGLPPPYTTAGQPYSDMKKTEAKHSGSGKKFLRLSKRSRQEEQQRRDYPAAVMA